MAGFSRNIQRFGGDWTEKKLNVLSGYLNAYVNVLKNSGLKTVYIDGFAGSGYRVPETDQRPDFGLSQSLFEDDEREEQRQLLDGSARIALKTESTFDQYVFIDLSAKRCQELEKLKREFPDLAQRIEIHQADANAKIKELCVESWQGRRAVLFLDPYGMEVEWSTLEMVARTRSIDLWLLFPLGTGVARLATKSGDIPVGWRHRLNKLLGTDDWFDEFYKVESQPNLFGEDTEYVERAGLDVIGRYFIRRLETIFAGVVKNPGVLRNSKNNPMYLLCFAASNARGKPIGLRIAGHLLRGMEQLEQGPGH